MILLQVITVEPGCYFIDALLIPAMESSSTSKFFNCEEISRFNGFGGVRIESDVVWYLLSSASQLNIKHRTCGYIFFANYAVFHF